MEKRERKMSEPQQILLPAKISKGMFGNERWIRIPPPTPYYEPSINGWVAEEMVVEGPDPEHNDQHGEHSGFVRATILRRVDREGVEGFLVALGGDLNHSDGVFFPVEYLRKHEVEIPQ